jgi:TonB family protein
MKLNRDNGKALIGTIIFHGLLLLALMFLALRTPLPLPGEQGVEVNLGNTNVGFGKKAMQTQQTPMKPKPLHKPIVRPTPPTPKPQPRPDVTKQKNLTQNVEKAPALPKKKKSAKKKPVEKKITKKATKKPKPVVKKSDSIANAHKTPPQKKPQPVVNPRALFKMAPGSQNQSEGVKAGTGDQGKPQGFKESNAFNGRGGKGHGISFSLGDRGAKFLDRPAATFTEQGTVVVRIEVNPSGKVTNARVFAKGTTVVSENLRHMAVQSAKNSLFSAEPTAPAVQIGTITYHFILKR